MATKRLGRKVLQGILMGALALATPLAARAADGDKAPQIAGARLVSNDPMESSKYLGSMYKDEVAGFRLAPPAGSRVITRAGIDLVSYICDDKQYWGGSLQDVKLDTDALMKERHLAEMTLKEFVNTTKNEIQNGRFKGVQIFDHPTTEFAGHEAVRFSASMQAELGSGMSTGVAALTKSKGLATENVMLLRQELVVKMKTNEFWVLMLYSPLSDQELATRTFDAMISQFEILSPTDVKKKRGDAISLGKQWLSQRSAEEFVTKINNQSQMMRIKIGSRDYGYIQFDEMTQEVKKNGSNQRVDVERDGHKGVLFTVNYRSFEDDAVNYGQNEAFWGFSHNAKNELLGHYSAWNNISERKVKVAPRPGMGNAGPAMQTLNPWQQETGITMQENGRPYSEQEIKDLEAQRQALISANPTKVPPPISALIADRQYHMIVTFAGDPTQRPPAGVDIKIPQQEAYPLPKILEYTWPRFVDLTKPSEMSFVVYNSKTNHLALRNLIVTGKKEVVTINGKDVSCFKCIDEVDPGFTTIWVDAAGKIQMMLTSDQTVMVPTTPDEMRVRWATRLADQ